MANTGGGVLTRIAAAFLIACLAYSAVAAETPEKPRQVRIDNGRTAVTVTRESDAANVLVAAADSNGEWVPICRTLRPDFKKTPDANKLFDTSVTPHRYQANEVFTEFSVTSPSETRPQITMRGRLKGRVVAEQVLTLDREGRGVHVDVSASLDDPLLDYFLSSWEFIPEGAPDLVHSPTAKKDDRRSGPAVDQVIGDHAFHSPAVVLQKGGRYVCMIPDLATINAHAVQSPDARRTQRVARNRFSVPIVDKYYTMPTALDLNARSGLTGQPVFSYGMMDFVVGHHVRYQRINDASMVRRLENPKVRYGYDLIVGADMPEGASFQAATRHIWQRYGHTEFRDKSHLTMPFAKYVRTIYDVVSRPMPPHIQAPVQGYEDHGVFVDFEMNGKPVGGMVSPLKVLGFGDALWNFEFWNNIRDANGMVYWGERLGLPKLKERGQRIINLALEAPRNEAGFFPLVYRLRTKQWVLSSLGPSPSPKAIFDRKASVYNVVGMSKSAAHMLEYYRRCGRDPRIVDYLRPFADGLVARIDARGATPSYYTPDMKPIADLQYSAQPAAMMWFLAEMAGVTGEARYRDGAERIAGYLVKEIIPKQRWIDLEVYYSCGRNPLSYTVDELQALPIRGNLSTHWAAKGFQALYKVTRDQAHLEAGAKAVDYLTFSQASWNPHYIYTANPFGGCTVDNVDTATWLDARQCELVQPFIWYGLELGRSDLVERGIAAARASTVLINHSRHIENGIYPHVNHYGFGLGPENVNHEGHNQSAMRTHPSWGECSGIFTGLADAARSTGGGIIDLDHGFAVGTDGINLSLERRGDTVHITAKGRFARLNKPWEKPYEVELKVHGEECPVHLNGARATVERSADGPVIRCRLAPDGAVTLAEHREAGTRPQVTLESLLEEMVGRDAVARVPEPFYTCKQASSWDRSQTVVGGKNWFANRDYDRALRKEANNGRTEYVVMEDKGPGCVTRIWKPLDIGNELPRATIRFYLDGEPEPAIDGDFTELLSARSIFAEPFSFIASDEKDRENQISLPPGYKQLGGDLYFPIPYAKGCKITLEPRYEPGTTDRHNVFFYIINYRSYEKGTAVETFSSNRYEAAKALARDVGERLNAPGSGIEINKTVSEETMIKPGGKLSVELPRGPAAVRKLVIQLDPNVPAAALRDLVVTMLFDGEDTVSCPVAELFGGGYFPKDAHPEKPDPDGSFIRPHWNWNRRVERSGRFSCYFVMPYRTSATVGISNAGDNAVPVSVSVGVGSWTWDDRSMTFHADWRSGRTPGRPADWNYVEIQGHGTYVADTLSLHNPVKTWYGEGDERVYIDGESFPSHLGTGTEDYYGYAWGMANIWNSAFISAPSRDARGKNDWSGYQTVSRERMLDAIPFRTSLKIDMEVGVWFPVKATYSVGTMWYARPGASSNRGPVSVEPDPTKPIVHAGAIECESLKVHKRSAGVVTEVQSLAPVGAHRFSNGAHLFVRPSKIGGFVELKVGAPGRRRIVLHGLKSWDYGIVRVSVNGRAAGKDLDMFSQTIVPTGPMDLGVSDPVDGAFVIRFEVVGKNPKSKQPGLYFGLDCIELQE